MNNNIDVYIAVGSNSDLDIMEPCVKVLENFNISYELKVVSAHRTPWSVISEALLLEKKNTKVIIAAAGKAAALPGVLAAFTVLPVIGVPINGGHLNGQDALFAIAQMPSGVPVATVGINESANAAYLALQILALNDHKLKESLSNDKLQRELDLQMKNKEVMQSFKERLKMISQNIESVSQHL